MERDEHSHLLSSIQTLDPNLLNSAQLTDTIGFGEQRSVGFVAPELEETIDPDDSDDPNEKITQPDPHQAQPSSERLDSQAPHESLAHEPLGRLIDQASRALNSATRFAAQGTVGEGAYGQVWRVHDHDLKRSVAIKTFKGSAQAALESCRAEMKFAGRLDHPSIPTVYDVGVTKSGHPFVVMELLDGESLHSVIERLQRGDEEAHESYSFIRRIELILQLLRVLKVVHERGVLHRDIKPENILINGEGHLYLLDWGCAVNIADVQSESQVCGTPLFMPPEQVLGRGLSPASDLFAVAGVAYELLSLSPAGPIESTLVESLKRILSYQPPQVDKVYHHTQGYPPSEFYPVIMRALKRHPVERPQSAEEMALFLRRALDGHIEVVCPRTFIKSLVARFTRWIDRNPYRVVPTIVASLVFTCLVLISLGALIGVWLS